MSRRVLKGFEPSALSINIKPFLIEQIRNKIVILIKKKPVTERKRVYPTSTIVERKMLQYRFLHLILLAHLD